MMRSYYDVAKANLSVFKNVECFLGDSASVLEVVLSLVDKPALFFLDAHYSGPGTARSDKDTPVVRELEILRAAPADSVIVIDDARLFAGEEYHTEDFADYPSFDWIRDFVADNFKDYEVWRLADEFVISPE
jgi:hypothetical protein